MDNNLPTSGQLERDLSQKIQKLYRQELEHSPCKVTCQLFSNQLAIVIEGALTAVEKILADADVVKEINTAINKSIQSKLTILVEETLAVEVDDILFASTFKTNQSCAIATLRQPPKVRNPYSIPKNKQSL